MYKLALWHIANTSSCERQMNQFLREVGFYYLKFVEQILLHPHHIQFHLFYWFEYKI